MLAVRLAGQLLSGPRADTVDQVVDRLLAVQAQDPRGFRLAVRARSRGTTSGDVDAALTERRSVIVTWLNRGTLHLVRAPDYWWLHPLTTPQLATGSARRLEQEGVAARAAARAVEVVAEQVAGGPRTRAELRAALDAAGIRTAGQALVHVLYAASLRGRLVRGPVREGEHCFVDPVQWLARPDDRPDRTESLRRLAVRYLAGHRRSTAADLAAWAGLTLRDARTGLAAAGDAVVVRDGVADLAENAAGTDDHAPLLPPPRLLGSYDPVLHGWRSRDFVLGGHGGVVTTNGLFRPFALVDGRAVATWGLDGARLTLRLREAVGADVLAALRDDAADVARFLRLPRVDVVVAG